jgi:hypothetical protein
VEKNSQKNIVLTLKIKRKLMDFQFCDNKLSIWRFCQNWRKIIDSESDRYPRGCYYDGQRLDVEILQVNKYQRMTKRMCHMPLTKQILQF